MCPFFHVHISEKVVLILENIRNSYKNVYSSKSGQLYKVKYRSNNIGTIVD